MAVWLFAAAFAALSVVATVIVVPLAFDIPDPVITLIKSAAIAFGCAFPTCWILFNEMYKNGVLTDELQRLVDRDRLTDVATRDFFFSRMAAAPEAYGVSLMVDIDHFKSINDTHGHLAGDAVIRAVARLLRDNVRPGDIVARFGGEEFLVFLQGTSPDGAFEIAERMREAIAEHRVAFEALDVGVTVSIGGSLKEARADIACAIRDADAALYRAKRAGRNQTIFAENAPDMTAS